MALTIDAVMVMKQRSARQKTGKEGTRTPLMSGPSAALLVAGHGLITFWQRWVYKGSVVTKVNEGHYM
jgi:hypothetical protein